MKNLNNKKAKLREYEKLYKTLHINDCDEIICKACKIKISSKTKFLVQQPLKTKTYNIHLKKYLLNNDTQQVLDFCKVGVKEILLRGFVGANIPLYKLRHTSVIKMFSDLNINTPSEYTI
ncbi:hypothetical protein DMUE_4394 [Dictyocoela muelleri]|nr:hypothetical protein DMUE_4394 [Dictyocoela muelleri]